MVGINTIRDETVFSYSTTGTDKVVADAKKIDAANAQIAKGEYTVSTATEKTTGRRLSAAAAVERHRRQVDLMYRAEQQLAQAQRIVERGWQQGILSLAEQNRLNALAAQRFEAQAAAARKAAAANDNLGKSTGIAGHHLQNLGYQLSDVAASLASGASPITILAQQGGQIAPILGETGVMGAVRGVGQAIGRFITPATVTVGALTGALAYGYSAWSRYDDEQRAAGATLQGLGRSAGLTRARFEELAESSAKAGNVSVRQASDLARAFAATGKIGPDNIARLIGIAKDAAATFDEDLVQVKDRLADAFSSQAGIDRLNDQLQFLDARTRQTIKSLFDQGKAQDAIRLAIERLPPALAKSEEAQGAMARAWKAIRDAVSDADHAIGRFIDRATKGPDPNDRLKELQENLARAKQAAATTAPVFQETFSPGSTETSRPAPSVFQENATSGAVADFRYPDPLKVKTSSQAVSEAEQALEKYMQTQAKAKLAEEQAAESRALEESLNKKSNQLRGIVDEVANGSQEWLRYRDLQTSVDEALKSGNPDLMRRVDNIRDLKEAQDVLAHVTKSTTDAEGQRLTQAQLAERQRQAEIASVRARTVEGRAEAAQMQAVERQRGQRITGVQAEADAQHAAQMVREQADSQLRDMIQGQEQEADQIRTRIALLSEDAETRTVVMARQRAQQDLARQGIDINSDLARTAIDGAEANARLEASYDRAVEAQRRLQDGARELGENFTSFTEDMLLGSRNWASAIDSLSKTLSSSTLQALLTGQGPLAGLLGTAPSSPGGLGGLLGGQISFGGLIDSKAIGDRMGEALAVVMPDAMSGAMKPLLAPKAGQGFMSTPLMGGLVSAGAGAALGYSTQSPIMGAAGGELAGFRVANDDKPQENAA